MGIGHDMAVLTSALKGTGLSELLVSLDLCLEKKESTDMKGISSEGN